MGCSRVSGGSCSSGSRVGGDSSSGVVLGKDEHCDAFDNFFGDDGVLVGVDLLTV